MNIPTKFGSNSSVVSKKMIKNRKDTFDTFWPLVSLCSFDQ